MSGRGGLGSRLGMPLSRNSHTSRNSNTSKTDAEKHRLTVLQKVKENLAAKLNHFISSLRELAFYFAFAHSKHLPQKTICVGLTVLNLLNLIAELALHSCRQLFLQAPKNFLVVDTFAFVVICHGEVRTI